MINPKHLAFGLVAAVVVGSTIAAEINNQGDAFNAGKNFSNGVKGKGAASGSVNANTGQANVPKYNTNPPEQGSYGNGRNLLGPVGNGKVTACQNYNAGNAYDQQECNAVKYLNNMNRSNGFVINKNTDPLMVGSKETIKNPGTIPATGSSVCHIETETIPGTFTTETCEESSVLTTFQCKKTLLPECGYAGANVQSHTEARTGAFSAVTFTPAGQPGLYNFNIEALRSCGAEGTGQIDFDLDTIGMGGYVKINLSTLDDAAAVAVNDSTVFAGHPNSGPALSGDAIFPPGHHEFQLGYQWQEDVGANRCVSYDIDGNCVSSVWSPDVRTFYANVKLLDSCPAGYAPTSQRTFMYCDGEGNCNPIDSYTPNNVGGLFCNAQGKFLMNKQEGIGTWGGSVSTTMPIVQGRNTIKVFWGTSPSGSACGRVKVYGQVFNVAPVCTARWDDQCAQARDSLPR